MNSEKGQTSALSPELKASPCKCDRCPWSGTLADTVMVDNKATCPQCGGSLAANRPIDQIINMVSELDDAKWDGWD